MAEHAWSGLKPSRARVADSRVSRRPDPNHGHPQPQGSLRGTAQWTPVASSDELQWGVASAGCLVPPSAGLEGPGAPGAPGALNRLVPEFAGAGGAGAAAPGVHGRDVLHRRGWKRFSLRTSEGKDAQRHCHRSDCTPCSEWELDEELTMYESQLTRSLSDHFSNLSSLPSSSLQQEMALVSEGNSGGPEASSSGLKSKTREGDELKRQRSGLLSETKIQRDAESRSFPQIDTKDGTLLDLEDYTVSKRWHFRFKYWINNKSRMYVLENTGRLGSEEAQGWQFEYFARCFKFVEHSKDDSSTTSNSEDESSSRNTDIDNSVANCS